MGLWTAGLVVGLAVAVQLVADLPELTVSDGEVFTVPLADYFQGNNVNFTLLGGAQSVMPGIEDPFDLKDMQQEFKYESEYMGPEGTLGGQMKVINQQGATFILNSYNNIIQSYYLDPYGIVYPQWNLTLRLSYAQPIIQKMCNLTGLHTNDLYVLVSSLETIGEWQFTRYDIFLLNITDLSIAPPYPLNLELEDIRYFSTVDMEAIYGDPYGYERILVTSCTEVRSPSESHNYLLFYNVTDPESVQFMQQVVAYAGIAGYTNDVPLHTVGFAYFQQNLYILDQGVGLFTFNFVGNFFLSSDFVDILRFGTPVSICAPMGDLGYLIVGTVNGLVLIDSGEISLMEYMWIPTILANGKAWVPLSSQSTGRYIFTNSQQSAQTSFLVTDITQPFGCYIQRQWRFSTLIPINVFLYNAPFILAQQLDPTILYLFRSDMDALRVFQVKVGTWAIEGTALESTQYTAQVLAVNLGNPLDTAVSNLYVNYLQLNDTSILLGTGYTLSSSSTPLTLAFTPDLTGTTALVSLNISQLYSGPGLVFSLSFSSLPDGISFNYTSEYEKLSLINSLDLELDTGNLAALSEGYAYIFVGKSIYIYNVNNETLKTYMTVDLGDYEGNYLAVANSRLYVLATNTVTGTLTLLGRSLDGEWSCTVSDTPADCFKVKSLFAYIVCVSQGEVTLFDWNLSLLGSVGAERMSLKAIQIVDISGQVTDYTQRSIMYFACKINGLVGVDITYFQYYEILGHFVGLSSATSGVYLLSLENTLAQANSDGSVFIINVENAPNIQLIRTLPSWSSSTLLGVRHIAGFLVAQQGATLYFYDFLTAVHSALYYSMSLHPECQFAGSGTNLVLFCPAAQGSSLLQYQPSGFSTSTGFVYSYNITLAIDLQQFSWDYKQVNGTLCVTNQAGSVVQAVVVVGVETQGHVVLQNVSALVGLVSIPYTQEAVFNLGTVFSGQNLRLFLNVNGDYPIFTPNSSKVDPIALAPSVDITSQYLLSPYLNACSVLLLPNNITILLTDDLVQVCEVQTEPSNSWLEPQNASLLAEIDFRTLANDSSIDTCSLLTLAYYAPPRVLVGFYCSGEMLLDSGQSMYDALILASLDLKSLNFTVAYKTFLAFPPIVMKAKYDIIQGYIYMLLIDSMGEAVFSNHLVWYMFNVTASGAVSMVGNSTIIDFFLLHIPTLCVQDADIYLRPNSGGYIYIADACYGVRIVTFAVPAGKGYALHYGGNGQVGDPEDPMTSILVCDGGLYALTHSGLLDRFNLSAPLNLAAMQPVQRYNPIGRNFTALPASLTCIPGSSLRPQSFLLGLLSTGTDSVYIRVYDLQASVNSTILRDIPLAEAGCCGYQPISGISGGSFVSLNLMYGFQVWTLHHPYLLVPALSSTNYMVMLEKWGGYNFSLFLTAENDQMSINSSVFFLSRPNASSPVGPGDGDSGSSSPYWWVWLLVAIAVVLTFIGISIAVRIYQRRQKEPDSEAASPSLLPINEQIDAYY